ncbi:MAG: transcription antitermination factor NusB [Alphaproteobacteria bacterium]|nr:transcription antitermination factor NusB [Alphaproteobacteria bacterium]
MKRPGEAARAAALALAEAVLVKGQPLDDAIRKAQAAGGRLATLEPRDRAFARLVVTTVLRRLGQIDTALAACLDRPLKGRALRVREILRLAAAQLLFLETPPHAAVDAAVRQAARFPAYRGLVNAVLRRLAAEAKTLLEHQDQVRLNCPDWLWRSWSGAYGEAKAQDIVAQLLAEPPLDITVRDAPEEWAGRLDARVLPTGSLRRLGGGAIETLPGYGQGAWWVQDTAASLLAPLLGEVRGRRVLDLCAAPGGKTLQLAAAGARVTALDISARRLELVAANLARTGLEAELIAADARQWRPESGFELILLDAPCTATGTIRRHPDIWRLKTAADVARMAILQAELLAAARAMLVPGGTVLYGCCSLEPVEGEAVIEAFLAADPALRRQPIAPAEIFGLETLLTPEGDLRTLPCHLGDSGGMDGFYAARLRLESQA